jgi:glycosyltransferase involved in cell wall biosynthesis
MSTVSGGTAVSPHLLSQLPPQVPQLMLRGVIGDDIVRACESAEKKDIVLFSGTHTPSNGIAELIESWRSVRLPGWELHITGYGRMTERLRHLASGVLGLVFHGLVSRPELVELMASAKICINPHASSRTPGNVFAFKLIEYLATGAHVLTTRMGPLEPELESGITCMPDNAPATIASFLEKAAGESRTRNAAIAARNLYGLEAVGRSLDDLLTQVMRGDAPASAVTTRTPGSLRTVTD